MKKYALILFLFILTFTIAKSESDFKALFKKANSEYMKDNYQKASESYQQIIKDGFVSSNVYYNLGNCYFRMKNYGKAILFYEKARRLNPSDESINLNLRIANLKIVDKIRPVPEFFINSFLKNLAMSQSADTFSWFGVFFIWIGLILVALIFLSNKISIKKTAFVSAVVVLIFIISSFYLAYESNEFLKNTSEGIVLTPSVYVKSSPDSGSLDAFILHEGTKFRIIDNLGTWTKIKISNGNIGWLDKSVYQEI